jgi:hypothetical protein
MKKSTPEPHTFDSLGETCDQCLEWAAKQDFAGYDPYDGLNSPYVSAISNNWLTRLISIHSVNKSPINLRPVLGVPKERNPKGIALFTLAYLNRYLETGRLADREAAERLLRWLSGHQAPGYDKAGWGYNFDWQNGRKFFLSAYEPNIVVTVFSGRAFLRFYEITGEDWALEMAKSAASFIRFNINQKRFNGYDVFTYTPHDEFILINTNAIAANFFYRLAGHTKSEPLAKRAEELFGFVVDTQRESGGWYYAVPADESHLSHDNFHTGFVLESLYVYATDQREEHPARDSYRNGMKFYRQNLFEEDGAPRFEADKGYPYDAHAAAQAVLTLVQRGTERDRELAWKTCQWSLDNLLDSEGYFYRRIGRLFTDETAYMRWSQAWMCRALSALSLRGTGCP